MHSSHYATTPFESLNVIWIIVRENARPLSREMLIRVNDEVDFLKGILEEVIAAKRKLTVDDQEKIKLIEQDMDITRASFDEIKAPGMPPRWPQCRVVVLLKPQNNSRIPFLRIWYVPKALYSKQQNGKPIAAKSFLKLGSPTERMMSEATYLMWAERDGRSSRISNLQEVKVRRDSERRQLSVELTVLF